MVIFWVISCLVFRPHMSFIIMPSSNLVLSEHNTSRHMFWAVWFWVFFFVRKGFLLATLRHSPTYKKTTRDRHMHGVICTCQIFLQLCLLAASLVSFCVFWREVQFSAMSLSCSIFFTCWYFTCKLFEDHCLSSRMEPRFCQETRISGLYLGFIRITSLMTAVWLLLIMRLSGIGSFWAQSLDPLQKKKPVTFTL